MRLARYMSISGVDSRRKCEEIIASGAVSVNNNIITKPGTKVSAGDVVKINGRIIDPENKVYIKLNKPRGYICSAHDPHGDKTIFDLLNGIETRLFSAGRLDLDSEGLIILTNDGDYAEKLTHPRFGTLKKYKVITDRAIPKNALDSLRKGIYDEDEFLKPVEIKKIKPKEYLFIMSEGKKREVRRLVRHSGVKVKRLIRTAIGELKLASLPTGKWQYLSRDEIAKTLK